MKGGDWSATMAPPPFVAPPSPKQTNLRHSIPTPRRARVRTSTATMFNGEDVTNVVGGRRSHTITADRDLKSPRAPVLTSVSSSPRSRYVPYRPRADGSIEVRNMDGSVRNVPPDPVELEKHLASIESLLPPVIIRPAPSTEYGRSCIEEMKEEVIQFYLDMQRSATKREAKERRKQGLEVLDVDDDAMWTAAGFKNWSNDQYDQLLVDMDRRRVEGKASARKRDEEREARRKVRREERFRKVHGHKHRDEAQLNEWCEAQPAARRQEREELDKQEPAALEKFLALLRKEFPTVPTAGWQVRLVHATDRKEGTRRYTPPPMRPDEIPSTPPLPTEFDSLVKVWKYCEERFRVTRTVVMNQQEEHAAPRRVPGTPEKGVSHRAHRGLAGASATRQDQKRSVLLHPPAHAAGRDPVCPTSPGLFRQLGEGVEVL